MPPTWLLITQKNKLVIGVTPFCGDREKEQVAKAMRARMARMGVTAYSCVCEAWTSTYKPEEVPGLPLKLFWPQVRPVDRFDRREIVMALASDGQEIRVRQWFQIRAEDGHLERLQLAQMENPEEFAGWMAHMLHEER